METPEKLDYTFLLMNHLNRLSFITTSQFIEAINKEDNQHYTNPPTIGITSFEWGIRFLYSVVPSALNDSTFNEQYNKLIAEFKQKDNGDTKLYLFNKLSIMINLLHRKGLLISHKMPSRAFKPKSKKQEEYSTEFEE